MYKNLFQFLILLVLLIINTCQKYHCQVLQSENIVYPRGDWGSTSYCPEGSYVIGMRLKILEYQKSWDDSGINAIEFFCSKPWHTTTHKIWSASQIWGEFGPDYFCPPFNFAFGFQLKSDGTPIGSDNAGAVNLRLFCKNEMSNKEWEITGQGVKNGQDLGRWTSKRTCSRGKYICSIRTRVQENQGIGIGYGMDDSALTQLEVNCCNYVET